MATSYTNVDYGLITNPKSIEYDQGYLIKLGYTNLPPTGQIDDAWSAVIAKFQTDNGLPVTGTLNYMTSRKIFSVRLEQIRGEARTRSYIILAVVGLGGLTTLGIGGYFLYQALNKKKPPQPALPPGYPPGYYPSASRAQISSQPYYRDFPVLTSGDEDDIPLP